MAYTTKEMTTIKQVILRHIQGESNRSIAKSLSMSKNTVNRYIRLAEADSMSLRDLVALDDVALDFRFNGGSPAYTDKRFKEFMELLPYFEEQLGRRHVTRQLLWEEYRREHPEGYSLSQFKFHLRQNVVALKGKVGTVLKDLHVGGDKLYLDFAGDPLSYVDRETGEVVRVQVFVAVLPASDYAFAMAVPSQRNDDFCPAVDCCLQALGGAPRQLVPDNLKAAVIKADRHCPTLNKAFEQLACHYSCVVNPARALHPKDKALVEDAVKLIYRRVYAPLRDRTFYDIATLNHAIAELVKAHNEKRMQTADYSRQERFLAIDKPNLQPLPPTRFELIRSVQVKVGNNGCVQLGTDRHYYSVPYKHIGRNATIRYTGRMVNVFIDGECVATHQREKRKGGYSLVDEHLASHCKDYRSRSPQYYIARAGQVSERFKCVMERLFASGGAPERYYRRADALLSISRVAERELFDTACQIAVDRDRCDPFYIKALVNSGCNGLKKAEDYSMPEHDNIRGASQYR